MEKVEEHVCIICSKGFSESNDKVSVGEKGINTIIKACQFHKDTEKENSIKKRLCSNPSTRYSVHSNCRKRYTNLRKVDVNTPPVKKSRSRQSMGSFNWKQCCLFWGEECNTSEKRKPDYSRVETIELRAKICNIGHISTDPKVLEVYHRILNCVDLVAVEAIYHKHCMPKFFQQSPKSEIKRSVGRPADQDMDKTFNEACAWLETCSGPVTMKELHDHVKASCSIKWLRKTLLTKYGTSLSVTSDGYRDYVILKDMAKHIINDKWYADRENNIYDEKERVVLAAA